MLREEQLVSRPLAECREHTIVAYQRFEFASQVMSLNPVCCDPWLANTLITVVQVSRQLTNHVATVRSTEGDRSISINIIHFLL